MGEASRKFDAIVKDVYFRMAKSGNPTVMRIRNTVAKRLRRPVHNINILNSLKRLDIEVASEFSEAGKGSG